MSRIRALSDDGAYLVNSFTTNTIVQLEMDRTFPLEIE